MNVRRPTISPSRSATNAIERPNGFAKCFQRNSACRSAPPGAAPSDAVINAAAAGTSASSIARMTTFSI
jgi:hypothetical protein